MTTGMPGNLDPAVPQAAGGKWNARSRSTPLAARGEPMVWLTGGALAVCAIMVVGLLAIVLFGGLRTFWPRPIELVKLVGVGGKPGEVFLGTVVRTDSYTPDPTERARIKALAQAGALAPDAVDSDGLPIRRLYRVGNKEFREQPFKWVPVYQIASTSLEPSATLLERRAWGVWHGFPTATVQIVEKEVPGPASAVVKAEVVGADGARVEREVVGEGAGGRVLVREKRTWEGTPEVVMQAFLAQHPSAVGRAAEIARLKEVEIGQINLGLEAERLRVRDAEIALARSEFGGADGLLGEGLAGVVVVVASATTALVCIGALVARLRARKPVEQGFLPEPDRRGALINALLLTVGLGLGLLAYAENPWAARKVTAQDVQAVRASAEQEIARLNGRYREVQREIAQVDTLDDQWRVVFTEPSTGRFAPVRQTEPDQPMRISAVVRAVQPNGMSFLGKLGVYLSRWGEFLFDVPREANTEGGIYPVIFGTVALTILLSIVVVPLGVIAALYLREYAKQGALTSLIRIAINNLAGVPSIVFGVFGLGFFVYTVGAFVDTGSGVLPGERVSLLGVVDTRQVVAWWVGVLLMGGLVVGAVLMGNLATPVPGKHATRLQENVGKIAFGAWCLASLGSLALLAYTPYFRGFFEARAPSPTFASKGMLWSAATLALLTLPVVIVATEEAIAAVPRTMREGSYGCGASKWQTMQRIVLPRAMPGIMTGMILAMARGAGEVAPLMLVGAVKLAESLPVDGNVPFVHLDRPFMHLGFHIYDVGFQSPDSEAARPVVWCTTLVLIVVVVALNITAIRIRSNLRRKFLGEAF